MADISRLNFQIAGRHPGACAVSALHAIALAYLLTQATCAPLDMTSWQETRQASRLNQPKTSSRTSKNYHLPTTRNRNYQMAMTRDLNGWLQLIKFHKKIAARANHQANNEFLTKPNNVKDGAKIASFGSNHYSPRSWDSRANVGMENSVIKPWQKREQSGYPETSLVNLYKRVKPVYNSFAVRKKSDSYDREGLGVMRQFQNLRQTHGKGDANNRWG